MTSSQLLQITLQSKRLRGKKSKMRGDPLLNQYSIGVPPAVRQTWSYIPRKKYNSLLPMKGYSKNRGKPLYFFLWFVAVGGCIMWWVWPILYKFIDLVKAITSIAGRRSSQLLRNLNFVAQLTISRLLALLIYARHYHMLLDLNIHQQFNRSAIIDVDFLFLFHSGCVGRRCRAIKVKSAFV